MIIVNILREGERGAEKAKGKKFHAS